MHGKSTENRPASKGRFLPQKHTHLWYAFDNPDAQIPKKGVHCNHNCNPQPHKKMQSAIRVLFHFINLKAKNHSQLTFFSL